MLKRFIPTYGESSDTVSHNTFRIGSNSVSLSRYVNEVSMDSYNTTSPSRKRYRNSSISFAHFVTANINAIVNDQLFSLTCFFKFHDPGRDLLAEYINNTNIDS